VCRLYKVNLTTSQFVYYTLRSSPLKKKKRLNSKLK